MRDVWVYARSRASVADVSVALAELGFAPHYVGTGESPAPTPRRPSLAALVAGPGESLPSDLFGRISATEELDDVGLLLVVEPEHLDSQPSLATAYELLVRPFSTTELEVRIARATQDVARANDTMIVRAGPIALNVAKYQVTIDGAPVDFAYMEYELLRFLMTHPNRVFSRGALLKCVWGYDYYGGARTVDVHIRRVRAKLGEEQAARIKTVRNVGYLFDQSFLEHASLVTGETLHIDCGEEPGH